MLWITVVIFALGFVYKKSKTVYFLQFLWMWIVLCLCNDFSRVDYQNYVRAFERHGTSPFIISNTEFGYFLTDKILYRLGCSFEMANLVYVTFVLFILFVIILKYVNYINIPASLFMFFPLLINGIQIRNALSAAIITWGLQYLFSDNNKDVVKYLLCVLCAMLFHVTSIFYLSFILVKFIRNYKTWLLIMSGVAIGALSLFNILRNFLSLLAGAARFSSKFSTANSLLECAVAAVWILFLLFILYGMNKLILQSESVKKEMYIGNYLLSFNIISIILIPMFYLDFSFERLFRNWIIYVFCFIAFFMEHRKEIKSLMYYFYMVCFVGWFMYSVVIFECILGDRINVIIKVYLENNNLFDHPIEYFGLMLLVALIAFILLGLDYSNKKTKIRRIKIKWN